jgi:hypothetical protein
MVRLSNGILFCTKEQALAWYRTSGWLAEEEELPMMEIQLRSITIPSLTDGWLTSCKPKKKPPKLSLESVRDLYDLMEMVYVESMCE